MSAIFEIGIKFEEKREKNLIDAINKILLEMFPNNPGYKLSKFRNKSMLEGYLPFEYAYTYGVLMKKIGLYLDLYPNIDINGRKKFEGVDCSWIMFVNSLGFYSTDAYEIINKDNPKAKEYIEELLSKIPYYNCIVHNYKSGEERL